jgi:hypothetical protein
MHPVKLRTLRAPFLISLCILVFCFLLSLSFPPKPHVILIGLDGVSPELLGQLMNSGKLPNTAELAQRGVFNKLLTHQFSYTEVVWPIIYTGYAPEHNGISIDSVCQHIETAITPDMREVPAIWESIAYNGGWSLVITPPDSYPAENVNHVMEISDCIFRDPFMGSNVSDAYSSDTVKQWSLVRLQWGMYDPWVTNTLNFVLQPVGFNKAFSSRISMLSQDPDKIRTLTDGIAWSFSHELLSTARLAQNGTLLNCDVMFVYFDGTDMVQHLYNDDLSLRVGSIGAKNVEAAMQIYDAVIGKIMDAAEPGTTFCIVSDHGFDMDPSDHVTFQYKQYGKRNTIEDTAAKARVATIKGKKLYTDIDVVNGYLLADLNDELTRKEKQTAVNFLRQQPNLYPIGLGLSDNHNSGIDYNLPNGYVEDSVPPPGIFVLSGPHTKENRRLGITTIYDVTPTLLYALNLDVPADMDGESKLNCFNRNWVNSNPLKMIARSPKRKKRAAANYWQDNSQRLLQLWGLGYIDNIK